MTDTEIQMTPSQVQPGKQNVLIVAATEEEVRFATFLLVVGWPKHEFHIDPVRTAEGRWATMGRVW